MTFKFYAPVFGLLMRFQRLFSSCKSQQFFLLFKSVCFDRSRFLKCLIYALHFWIIILDISLNQEGQTPFPSLHCCSTLKPVFASWQNLHNGALSWVEALSRRDQLVSFARLLSSLSLVCKLVKKEIRKTWHRVEAPYTKMYCIDTGHVGGCQR